MTPPTAAAAKAPTLAAQHLKPKSDIEISQAAKKRRIVDVARERLGIAPEKEYSTYEYLGNIGTVSLPLTAALAEEREFLCPGDRVGLLGIGSGLNCLMLGVEW